MGGRGVEGIEVVPAQLRFRSGGHAVPEADEDIDHLVDGQLDQMEGAPGKADRLEGHVDSVAGEAVPLLQQRKSHPALGDQALDLRGGLVESGADHGALRRVHASHRPSRGADRGILAEKSAFDSVQLAERLCAVDCGGGSGKSFFQLRDHIHVGGRLDPTTITADPHRVTPRVGGWSTARR